MVASHLCAAALLLSPVSAFLISATRATSLTRTSEVQASIAVFGASGGTGSEAVLQALQRGESVTCLVRDKSKLTAPRTVDAFTEGSTSGFSATTNDKLNVVQGSVTNKADVDAVFSGQDVTGVVIALGAQDAQQTGPWAARCSHVPLPPQWTRRERRRVRPRA